MAKALDDSELWFPEKEKNKNGAVNTELLDAEFGFPSEFPYEFDSFRLEPLNSSPVESVEGSTETESGDEEDFFAGLTRRLRQATIHETRNQKLSVPINNSDKAGKEKEIRVLPGSPQSILSGIGSWSCRSGGSGDGSPDGGCSRVPSPFSAANDALDVIYAAADQVARLKLNADADFHSKGVLGSLPHAAVSFQKPNLPQVFNHAPQFQYQQVSPEQVLNQQCGSIWGREPIQAQNRGYDSGVKCSPSPSLAHHAWPPLHAKLQHQNLNRVGSGFRPGLQTGSDGVKRGCAGTGVFLPRQYGPPPEPRKKTNCASSIVVPANIFHALNMNIDELNGTTQPRFSIGLGTDYDALLARRNALIMQQQRLALIRREEAARSYEVRLPQEWTY